MIAATRNKPRVNWREAIWGYILIAPGFLFVFAFVLIPVISAFGISFTNWNLINAPKFVGISNYVKIFTDAVAVKTLLNTFYFTFVSVPVSLALSLVLAVLLNQKIRGLTFFRTAYYIPVISSTVAVAMVFLWIFDSNYGLMNQFLGLFGVSPIKWLTDPHYAMLAVIIVTVWRSLGFNDHLPGRIARRPQRPARCGSYRWGGRGAKVLQYHHSAHFSGDFLYPHYQLDQLFPEL